METVVIVDAIRTPMGRSKGGAFRHLRAADLSAHLMRSLLARHPALDPTALDDIYRGCVPQTLAPGPDPVTPAGRRACPRRGPAGGKGGRPEHGSKWVRE